MEINKTVFDVFPELRTERLTLRQLVRSDAEEIYRMRANKRSSQFIARHEMEKTEDAEELLERTVKAYNEKQSIAWAGLLRDQSKVIGACGFNSIDYPNLRAEIGGELSIDYWGKKIALEAVRAIVHFGFETMGLHSIEARVDPHNRGAVFLLGTLGFKQEALFRERVYFNGEFSDLAVYSLINGI